MGVGLTNVPDAVGEGMPMMFPNQLGEQGIVCLSGWFEFG